MTEQRMNMRGGMWIPLMDYATKKNLSLSTLRRYIKADKVMYKVEQGRYLLWDENLNVEQPSFPTQIEFEEEEVAFLQVSLRQLEQDLKRAHEEIAELKTLIALYEEQIPQQRLSG